MSCEVEYNFQKSAMCLSIQTVHLSTFYQDYLKFCIITEVLKSKNINSTSYSVYHFVLI